MLLTLDWRAGSGPVAEIAALVRPRYHFAGTKNTFYARPPYSNPDLGAGSHVTRFIGLAAVGNVAKQKSLHALGLVPAAEMDMETLQQKPEVSFPAILCTHRALRHRACMAGPCITRLCILALCVTKLCITRGASQ